MGKLHRTNAGYLGVSMEETQDPFWTYNKLALPLSQGEPLLSSTGALPIYNTTDAFGATKGSGVRSDAFASSIVLAIPMDGTNGGTSFSDESANIKGSGSAKSITVSSLTTNTAQSKYYGSSGGLFSYSSANFISVPDQSDLEFGSGDFTIELWLYLSNTTNRYEGIFSKPGNSDANGFIFYKETNGELNFAAATGGGNNWNIGITFGHCRGFANTWTHVAISREGSNVRGYVNGVNIATNTAGGTIVDNGNPLYIGKYTQFPGTNTYGFDGYISDFRIYKGVAKYTSDFIIPESGPSTFDRSPSRKVVYSTGATWQTSVSKFYGGATFYDGNADYQQTPYNADFNFGSGDFTIESFIRLSTLGASKIIANYIASTATTGNDLGWIFDVNSSNQLEGVLYSGTSAVGLIQAGSLITGTWYHVAYVRSGSTFLMFLDGSQIGSATGTSAHNVNTGWNVSIGYGHTSGTQYMNGYIQDLRIYKGIAKYTSSFTPPARSLVQTARRYPAGMHVLS